MKNLLCYTAGVLTVPAAVIIFRKPIIGTLAWMLAHEDIDERWAEIVETRQRLRDSEPNKNRESFRKDQS